MGLGQPMGAIARRGERLCRNETRRRGNLSARPSSTGSRGIRRERRDDGRGALARCAGVRHSADVRILHNDV